jgi:serine/threonine protein kinase
MKVCSVCKRCFKDAVLSCDNDAHPPLKEARGGEFGTIAGYSIETQIEANSRAEMFRARHDDSGQPCMVKLVSAGPDAGLRFLEDAKLAATLFHANVADVYESGELEGGTFYVVAEDLDTQTLRDVLDTSGPPELLDSIRIIRQTAEAVHALHLKGLTHRALRPENIRLYTEEEPQVRIAGIDFGGIEEQGIVSNKFMIDTAIDSIRYFAPEQCTGEGGSSRSDVYALGILLYEMLAGVPPFEATKATALIEMHRNQRPPELKIENFDLRMLLTHTITESLQKKASFRQCSADLFARQMRHIEQLATHVSTPPPAVIIPGTPRVNFAAARVQSAPPAYRVATCEEEPLPVTVRHSEPEPIVFEEPMVLAEQVSMSQPAADHITAVGNVFEEIKMCPSDIENLTTREQVDEIPLPMPDTELSVSKIETLTEAKPEPAVRRSRLKLKKKQLHAFAAAAPLPRAPEFIKSPESHLADAVAQAEAIPVDKPVTVVAAPTPVRMIEFGLPEDDIPTLDDVMEVLAQEPVTTIPAAIPGAFQEKCIEAPPVAPAISVKKMPARVPIAAMVAEEITADPPIRTRVNVEWDKLAVKSPPRVINRVEFVPTLLGNGGAANQMISTMDDSIFGTYRVPTSSRFALPYRAMAAGGVLVVLASLFFSWSDSVGSVAESMNGSDDTIATTAQPLAAPQQQTTQAAFPQAQPLQEEEIRPVRTFQGPVRETVDIEPIPTKQASTKMRAAVEVAEPKPVRQKSVAKSPLVPTTRVISTENGETKSRIVSARETTEKKAATAKSSGASRPRIVQVPE